MKRYYLFTADEHEKIRLDYTPKTIDNIIFMWEGGATRSQICKRNKINETELMLIVIDLYHAGRLGERPGGFWAS